MWSIDNEREENSRIIVIIVHKSFIKIDFCDISAFKRGLQNVNSRPLYIVVGLKIIQYDKVCNQRWFCMRILSAYLSLRP